MRAASTLRWTVLALALSGLAALPAMAQQDPPTRAGRIAYVAGPVSFSPAGTDAWAQAPLNRPLVAGDRLWTEPGARDEAQFGPAIARMDGGTLLSVLAADEGTTQLQLSQGRIDLHVRRIGPGETVEIDTPNLAFVARAPGDYRIAVAPDGSSTDVAALRGSGDVYGDGNAYRLGPGQGYRFGGQDLDNLGALPIQSYDDFDRWAFQRDRRLDHAQSARFVPADVVGYEDLDDNGAWRVVPDYGTVWVPTRVAAGWAPYQSGHWAWIDPWGWTWVDDQPWGYAVSHYGRWANLDGRWAWVPSPPRERPVFAPALVAFVGATLALGASRDEGPGVGWFPLGPREAYRPPYHASQAYVTRVNVSNTPIRPEMLQHELRDPRAMRYANRAVPGALMAMPAAQFAQAVPVNRAARTLPPRLALSAPLTAAPVARVLPQSRFGMPPAHGLPPLGVQQRVAVAHHGFPGLAGRQPAPAFAQRAGAPAPQAGRVAPVRMLHPAPAVRPDVPPNAAGARQLAAGAGAMPRAVAAMPNGAPYPEHGHAQANPGMAFEHDRGGRAGAPHAPGRSGMQELRAGGREPRPVAAPAAPHAAPGHPIQMPAHAAPQAHAVTVQHMAPHLQAEAAPAPRQAPRASPPTLRAAPPPQRPGPYAQPAPPPHAQPAPHPQPAPAPHPQPAPQPQPAPHPQPAPPPHPQAAAPHPEPPHPQPEARGGGHEGNRDHGRGH